MTRRSPKTLDRERRLARLIAQANGTEEFTTEQLGLRALIEDPAYHSGALSPSRERKVNLTPPRDWGREDQHTYEKLAGRIRTMTAKNQEGEFNDLLKRLFTAIARAGADGPLLPTPI